MKHLFLWASVTSVLLALSEFASSACSILCWHFLGSFVPQSTAPHKYSYYLEFSNGTRLKKYSSISYDDKMAQIVFLQSVLVVFASLGIAWPYLLHLAYKRRSAILLMWWICWISLHNVHSFVELFVKLLKYMVSWVGGWIVIVLVLPLLLVCATSLFQISMQVAGGEVRCFCGHLIQELVCYGLSSLKSAITPFTVYLSLIAIRHYRKLTASNQRPSQAANGRKQSKQGHNNSNRIMRNGANNDQELGIPPGVNSTAELLQSPSSSEEN